MTKLRQNVAVAKLRIETAQRGIRTGSTKVLPTPQSLSGNLTVKRQVCRWPKVVENNKWLWENPWFLRNSASSDFVAYASDVVDSNVWGTAADSWTHLITSIVTFIDETEGLSNSYESGSESETPFAPSEDRPSVSADSTASSQVDRSAVSPSLSSIRLIPDSVIRRTPRSAENALPLGSLASTIDILGQHNLSSKSPVFPHNDFEQLPSPDPSTGKAIAEEDSVALAYDPFQTGIEPPPPPSIYLDTPVWPLTDPSEAVLLRHFVQNLATWVSYPFKFNILLSKSNISYVAGSLRSNATFSGRSSSKSGHMPNPSERNLCIICKAPEPYWKLWFLCIKSLSWRMPQIPYPNAEQHSHDIWWNFIRGNHHLESSGRDRPSWLWFPRSHAWYSSLCWCSRSLRHARRLERSCILGWSQARDIRGDGEAKSRQNQSWSMPRWSVHRARQWFWMGQQSSCSLRWRAQLLLRTRRCLSFQMDGVEGVQWEVARNEAELIHTNFL